MGDDRRFNLIFADPPYTGPGQPEDFSARLVESEALAAVLRPEGLFVLEKSPRHSLPILEANGWESIRQKRYGTTEVIFLVRRDTAPITTDMPPEDPRRKRIVVSFYSL